MSEMLLALKKETDYTICQNNMQNPPVVAGSQKEAYYAR